MKSASFTGLAVCLVFVFTTSTREPALFFTLAGIWFVVGFLIGLLITLKPPV